MSVLIADVVRRELGIGAYQATREEVERWKEEIPLYKQVQHLQYEPPDKEVELAVGGCPVCVDGEGTEDAEISGYRDLARMETNRVRGGACLVVAEGLCLKAQKIQKHVKKLKIDGWEFVDKVVRLKAKSEDSESVNGLEPSEKFIKDVVAGRPVYSHPSRKGGFRLRYGRSRTAGLASISVHPATMYILEETMAIGTQIKIERPGKAGISTPCDRLEGPLVLLKNNDLVRIRSISEAKANATNIAEIIELGEVLIPVGEFLENNHPLVPGVFDMGWYMAELENAGVKDPEQYADIDLKKAIELAGEKNVPLHPTYTFMWNNLTMEQVDALRESVIKNGQVLKDELHLPDEILIREILIELGAPHKRDKDGRLHVENGLALLASLGIANKKGKLSVSKGVKSKRKDTLSYVSSLAGFTIGDKCGTLIGARMARPEKAFERKMNPPVHGLFPVGMAGGPQRLLNKAEKVPTSALKLDVGVRRCSECGQKGYLPICDCGGYTVSKDKFESQELDLYNVLRAARRRLNMGEIPKVKGVQGMISKNKTPEMPDKGILRSKHSVFVFKDGTTRFDCTDAPLTHFRPREIGTDLKKLAEMGYTADVDGNELENADQLVELKVQDIILPENGGDYLLNVANFIDELLVSFYGLKSFYNANKRDDLVGASLLGLSPHTSGGVLARLIGFTRASVGYAHPYFHAAKRRNCDGDEDCFMLLMDGLLNFSLSFLPEKRGGRMDAPLLLMTRIDPNEIDKEAHNIDVMASYPIGLYKATLTNTDPKSIENELDTVGGRIGSVLQYENFGFTLDTDDIAAGPTVSVYKTLGTMMEKTRLQLDLAKRIRAVDERDVAERLISNHFLPDMIGNLKKFSSQKVRCTKCGKKYRRIPLAGNCTCGHNLILTVHEASVRKYLDISKDIAKEFDVSPYVSQRIDIMEEAMSSMFQNQRVKVCTLEDF
jgi:DNA polymerase II large subunit